MQNEPHHSTFTAGPSAGVGEYYKDNAPAVPQDSPQRYAPASARATLSGIGDQMLRPLPRLVAGAALGGGAILALISELNKGGKDHHTKTGRYGRIAMSAGAAYYGLLWAMQALEDMPGGNF